MGEVAVLQETLAERSRGTDRAPLLGIALVSFGALLLELALTRLFSVVLFYHFAFLAISIALLGLGGGGVLAYVTRGKLGNVSTRNLAVRLCAANAVLVVIVLWIVLHSEIGLSLDWKNFARLTAMYLASGLPFLFTGALFSVVFARETTRVGQLYGADLLGGALACLTVVPLLNWVGAPNVVLLVAVAMAVAAAVWSPNAKARWAVLALAVIIGSVVAVNHSGRWFDIIYAKGSRRDEPWVDFVRWNAISRIEVDKQGNALAIVIDADASTYVMGVDPNKVDDSKWKQPLMAAPSAVVNVLRPHGSYAIIGPGGGVDVLRAVVSGSPSVTGIEINPIIATTIMRQRYAGLAHHLYDLPQVHIHVSDGRSWVRSSREHFDVLQMTLVDTWASTAAGAFALSENNLYTVQAFKEYFEHLKPDGIIAITRWEFKEPREALRVVSQGMQALYELGTRDDLKTHFLVVSDGPLDVDGRPVTVLAKKSPFTPEEEQQALAHIAANHNLRALYLPSAPELGGAKLGPTGGLVYPATADAFTYLIQSNNPLHFARGYAYNVAPVYDNNPFFFFTLKPQQVFHQVFGTAQEGLDWKVNLGIAVLGIVLILSIAAVLLLLVLPLAIYAPARRQSARRLFYFVAVGLGYILVEIAFIQRFVLFLGHPVYALTVVVFLMLLASGAGSVASRHWLADSSKLRRPLLIIVPAIGALVWALPQVLTGLVGLPFPVKLGLSGILLVPLGFFMGMPFPTGLRAMARAAEAGTQPDENGIEWAWAMNAAASVLGSVLAISIAILAGLSITLACGAAAYLLAMLLAPSVSVRAAA